MSHRGPQIHKYFCHYTLNTIINISQEAKTDVPNNVFYFAIFYSIAMD